jgi:phospholipase C
VNVGIRELVVTEESGVANLEKVDHIVVLMLENRSFDHMLGLSRWRGVAAMSMVCERSSPTSTTGASIRFTIWRARRSWTIPIMPATRSTCS